jgi:5-methylcytosine-specific restriction endonuclease McrA
MPTRGESADGRWFDISLDARLPGLFQVFKDDACEHVEKIVVRRLNSAGKPFFTRYCSGCGVKFGSHVPRVEAEAVGISPFSEEEIEAVGRDYTEERQAHLDAIVAAATERAAEYKNEADEEWQREYADYLRSPVWKRRAAKIMERARGVCEGCLTNQAQEVHHLTYAHVKDEFAFELVALCSSCHRRWHGRDAG